MSDAERNRAIHEAVGWDDRKALSSLWQDHAPLPAGGLTEQVYDALIAVASWGAGCLYDNEVDANEETP